MFCVGEVSGIWVFRNIVGGIIFGRGCFVDELVMIIKS